MSVLKTEEYRSLPNSRWLRKLLKHQVQLLEGMTDEKWIKAFNSNTSSSSRITPEETQEDKINLEILTNILEQCKKTGKDKPISLTKMQWDCMYKCLDDISIMGHYFDTGYWNTNRTKLFDIRMELKNIHSLDKYIDLFKSSAPSSHELQKEWPGELTNDCKNDRR